MLRAHSTAASTTCSPRSFNSSCPFHHQQQRRQQPCPAAADNVTYTPVDNSTASATFTPPVLDISNLLAGQAATAAQIQQVGWKLMHIRAEVAGTRGGTRGSAKAF